MTETTEQDRLQGRLDNLRLRARTLAAIRRFFERHDYLEVETPLLVPSPGLELHLRAVPAGDGWLATSPEYQMKRLLAGGLENIFQICRAFRADERGGHHVREFTILEWYHVGAELAELMEETEQLLLTVADAVRGTTAVHGVDGHPVDLAPPWERLTVAEAFERYAGFPCDGKESGAELASRARDVGRDIPWNAITWDEVFSRVFVEAIEPHLGRGKPTILHGWPARQAALARLDPDNPQVAQRFEVFAGGLELANAFCELTDPAEQRRRLESDCEKRAKRGLDEYPLDEKFLAALEEGIPPTSGIALGVDRLVMLLAGANHIDEVLTFAPEEL